MNSEDQNIQQLRFFLSQFSEKAGNAFMETAPSVSTLLTQEEMVLWVQFGSRIAQTSATAAIKFFRESPSIISEGKKGFAIQEIFKIGTQFAGENYGIALEFFRQFPRVIERIPPEHLNTWANIGEKIGKEEYGTAIEYFKQSPALIPFLKVPQLDAWARLGLILGLEDLKTKDFLSIEFFRLSPDILSKIPSHPLRTKTLALTTILAEDSGKKAMEFFRKSPTFLPAFHPYQHHAIIFEFAEKLAQLAPESLADYFKNGFEILKIVEGSIPKFEEWALKGINIAKKSPDGARGYFSLRLKVSQDTAKNLTQGLLLREVSRTLRLFAEGICGKPVEIRSGSEAPGIPSHSGDVITLPEKITAFPTIEENFRFYKVMVLHEAAHIEFGTYSKIPPELFESLKKSIIKISEETKPETLCGLFKLFPDPMLARNLWTIVEEGRIDWLLHHEYPGIRGDLDFVISQQLKGRPNLFELPPKQAFLEALLRLSVADTAEVPLGLAEEISQAYSILKTVQHSHATLTDSVRAVVFLYPLLEQYLEERSQDQPQTPTEESASQPPPDAPNEGHEPMANFSFRSPLDIRKIDRLQTIHEPGDEGAQTQSSELTSTQVSTGSSRHSSGEQLESSPFSPSEGQDFHVYDEWDYASGDFKPGWCKLFEKKIVGDSNSFIDTVRAEYGGTILSLRRYFECLRPEGFKKVKKQEHGEEIDLESAIQAHIEKKARRSPSNRVYTRREKKARDVSVAFLMDISGSTSQQLEGLGKSVIDVQKEGLVLLSEALDAIGDEYGLYGFSGRSRNQVDCYPIKEFDDKYDHSTQSHIGGIQPLGQNRDGTAIRHITKKLLRRGSKIKILILISDGKPLDDDYSGTYALEDTKMALREARAIGIYPFCITVDQKAPEYIEQMYGDVRYTIIQNIHSLPEKLPRIYKALTT